MLLVDMLCLTHKISDRLVVTRNTRRIRLYLASNWPSAQTFAHAMSQLRSP